MKRETLSLFWLPLVAVLLGLLLFLPKRADAAGEFITTWKTDIGNASDASLRIPTHPDKTYNYTVDWGDGNTSSGITSDTTHTYSSPGTYTVMISGEFPHFYMNGDAEAVKLQTVEAWGSNQWESMDSAFEGARYLRLNATDIPDLSQVESLSYMFYDNQVLNDDIGSWDVSNVTDFSRMLERAYKFNQNISGWDVSAAENMDALFRKAYEYNQPLDQWDVSNVESMIYTFSEAYKFNQDLSGWRLPNVVSTEYMFDRAQDFNQDLSGWNIDSLERASFMFTGSALSWENYDALLIGWSNDAVQDNVSFTGIDSVYCNGFVAKDFLTTTKGWTISDEGADTSLCAPTDIEFLNQTDPNVDENAANAVIGTLTSIDIDNDDTHTYSLECSVDYPDRVFFSVSGAMLLTESALDYDNPQDSNQDNSYEICIRSTDINGAYIEKMFTVVVNDLDDEQADPDPSSQTGNQPSDDTDNQGGVTVEEGAVLGTSTSADTNVSNDQGQVLADSDAQTLAETGVQAIHVIAIGVVVAIASYSLSHRTIKTNYYRIHK